MFRVDNSGRGNCLYYAYGISLMYYLRHANSVDVTENIFSKLKLDEKDRDSLRKVLLTPDDRPFSLTDIKMTIEPILGKACRNLAAETIRDEFINSARDTSLYTAAKYSIFYGFKRSFEEQESELSTLIENDFSNPDYLNADIYKVEGIGSKLESFIRSRTSSVIETFEKQWNDKAKGLDENELLEKGQFYKVSILDEILANETIEFFLSNDEENLNEYINHLNTNYVWGSEESLMILHRAIQGERMVRLSENRVEPAYDNEIVLHIYRNGDKPPYLSGTPALILNNNWNTHWTSVIPKAVFTCHLNEQELRLVEALDQMKVDMGKKTLGLENYPLMDDWIGGLLKQIEVIKLCRDSSAKEKEVEEFFKIISKASLALSKEPASRKALSGIFSAFLDCIPTYEVDSKMEKGVRSLSMFGSEKAVKPEDVSTSTKEKEDEVFEKKEPSTL